jgi:hypothetical protein
MSRAENFAPWLPPGLTFMSGLLKAVRRRRSVVAMQTWIDESGTRGQSHWFVMVGLMGRCEDWAAFSDQWKAVCNESPAIPAFHFRDAKSCEGVFKGFSEAERNTKVRELVRVIGSYPFGGITCAIDIDAFARLLQEKKRPPVRDVYAFTFNSMLTSVCLDLFHMGHKEKSEVFFDERKQEGLKIKKWYPIFRETHPKKLIDMLPIEPVFRDDEDFAPLQAADLLTGVIARKYEERAHSLDWLLAEPLVLRRSNFSQVYDEARLGSIAGDAVLPHMSRKAIEKALRLKREIYGDRD